MRVIEWDTIRFMEENGFRDLDFGAFRKEITIENKIYQIHYRTSPKNFIGSVEIYSLFDIRRIYLRGEEYQLQIIKIVLKNIEFIPSMFSVCAIQTNLHVNKFIKGKDLLYSSILSERELVINLSQDQIVIYSPLKEK